MEEKDDPEQPVVITVNKVPFTIGKCIGHGSFSTVFRVTSPHGEELACKILDKKNLSDHVLDNFLPRELNIVRTIRHPNIVKVHMIKENKSLVSIFMELCPHGTLADHIHTKKALKQEEARPLFIQITDAMSYLHNREVAHRDLKCENIFMMTPTDIRVGDFGFAKRCIDDNNEEIFTDTICGTYGYIPPEALQKKTYDMKKLDVWSLGCVLYMMVTGSIPFNGHNLKNTIKLQLNGYIFSKTKYWPNSQFFLKGLVLCMLNPNFENRVNMEQVRESAWLTYE